MNSKHAYIGGGSVKNARLFLTSVLFSLLAFIPPLAGTEAASPTSRTTSVLVVVGEVTPYWTVTNFFGHWLSFHGLRFNSPEQAFEYICSRLSSNSGFERPFSHTTPADIRQETVYVHCGGGPEVILQSGCPQFPANLRRTHFWAPQCLIVEGRCLAGLNITFDPQEPGEFFCGHTGGVVPAFNQGPSCPSCGNPANPAVGNKFLVEQDHAVAKPFAPEIRRYYNSTLLPRFGFEVSRMGPNWRHSYERFIEAFSDGRSYASAFVKRPDGKVVAFTARGKNGQPPPLVGPYLADDFVLDRLERIIDPPSGGVFSGEGWKYTSAEGDLVEIYNSAGFLKSITNRAGLTQQLFYDQYNKLTSVTDSFGRTLGFSYDAAGRVSAIEVSGVERYQYGYDGAGNLVSVTFPDATVRTYHYEDPAFPDALTGITDESGHRFATYAYDAQKRVVSTHHGGGADAVTLEYAGSETRVTDAAGAARSYGFTNAVGIPRNTEIQGPPCPACGKAATTYDTRDFVASTTDWNGNVTKYVKDARGLETSRIEGFASPQQRTIATEWHPVYRLATRIAEPLRITTMEYGDSTNPNPGSRGALLRKTIQPTDDATGAQGFGAVSSGAARTWSYVYNANGDVVTIDGPRTDVSDITSYTYYANDDPEVARRGNVSRITNSAGHVTSVTAYNAHGQPLTIVDPNALTTTMTYDARQRLKTRTAGDERTSYDHDGVGQLQKVTLPDGSFLSYNYDDAHRLTSMEDNLGNRIAYTLDAMGNRTQEQVFDPVNQLAQTRSRVFNNLNRLFRELGATGQTTEYGYDNEGNVISVRDPLNRVTSNQYDALNRLRQVTDPASGATQYGYNGLDALTSVSDPRNLVTGYAVDGLGNVNVQASPDTGTTTNTYDTAGNLLTQTDAKGQVTSYSYDALNRVTFITFHDGSKRAYVYDDGANAIGRLTSITEVDPANQVTSAIVYSYDQHGRVTSETRTVGGVQYLLAYSYDGFGRLSALTYPSGRAVSYGFDALGRVNQVTTTKDGESQVVVQNVGYQPFGGVRSYTLGNGLVYSRGIDLDGRSTSYTLGAQALAIGYDAASRIAFVSDVGNPANSNTYGYDSLDRLTSAVLPATPYLYTYDAAGNRMSRTAGSSTDNYAYSETSNRISSITSSSGSVRNFAFDASGSTTADGLNTYGYDVRGRMVQAVSAFGITNYQVNALGQRIRKSNSVGDTVFHYDTQGRLIAETDPSGSLRREVIYLHDILVGIVQ